MTRSNEKPKFAEHPLEWVLTLFADVRAGEAATALLLTVNVFMLLTAYYLLKVAREPLILIGGGAEVKSYAAVGQSILLVLVTSGYGWLASRVGRMQLIGWVSVIFVMNLVAFSTLGVRGVPLGVPFFLWVGIFNVMSVAQFWSFAADIYTDEQGKRLFPILGIGSSVGAVGGAWIAALLVKQGPFRLMLISSGMLLVCLGATYVVHRRESVGEALGVDGERKKRIQDAPLGRDNGFALLFRDRYLLLFAGVLFVLNFVTKTGDYVLDKWLLEAAHTHTDPSAFVAAFKARYFAWSNGLGVVCQLFFVSRIIKHLGIRWALYLMPLGSLAGYGSAFVMPALGVLMVARVVESGLDYSLWNTTRNAMWLVTSRQAKYKVKQIIDTFVVRAGDASSAALVWIGVRWHLPLRSFVAVNIALSVTWFVLVVFLARENGKRTSAETAPCGRVPMSDSRPVISSSWNVSSATARTADRPARPPMSKQHTVLLEDPANEADHLRGPRDAEVTIVEYGDFECHFCMRAHAVLRQLQEEFPMVLRVAFRHSPRSHAHPNARLAAEASEAAAAQGRFWDMHDRMFAHQEALTEPNLIEHARALGLDLARFVDDLRTHVHGPRVDALAATGAHSVLSTPTLFIDGVRFDEGLDFSTLELAIRDLLQVARGATRLTRSESGAERFAQNVTIGPHTLIVDRPAATGGSDTGPDPHDLLAAAWASCTAMTVREAARRRGWPLRSVAVDVTRARRGGALEMHRAIYLTGDLDEEQREALYQACIRSPVTMSLVRGVTLSSELGQAAMPANR